jgi:hypothetical protein
VKEFKTMLKKKFPDLYAHMMENEISIEAYFSSYYITLFSYSSPYELSVRIFDVFLNGIIIDLTFVEGEGVILEMINKILKKKQ